jgi:hypothetical protein
LPGLNNGLPNKSRTLIRLLRSSAEVRNSTSNLSIGDFR